MGKVLNYKERESLNTKLVAQAILDRKEREAREAAGASEQTSQPLNPFNWILAVTLFALFAGALYATEPDSMAQEIFIGIRNFLNPHHAIWFPILAALAALIVWGVQAVAIKATKPSPLAKFTVRVFYAVVVAGLLTSSVGTAIGGFILAQRASDAITQQWAADADLISLMTPYEKDAYSAYLRYEQNPTESFVTTSGTHVGVVGVDGCALMWNDSLREPVSRIIDKSSIADLSTYQDFIDHDVNDAGFSRFWKERSGEDLAMGYLLNAQGCQRNADGLIDGNALKAAAIKVSN